MPLGIDPKVDFFNIEMQTTLPTDLPKRLTYYNCLNYVRQLSEGSPYLDLRPAISIIFFNTPRTWKLMSCHAFWWQRSIVKRRRYWK
jgi:hypothetical protein